MFLWFSFLHSVSFYLFLAYCLFLPYLYFLYLYLAFRISLSFFFFLYLSLLIFLSSLFLLFCPSLPLSHSHTYSLSIYPSLCSLLSVSPCISLSLYLYLSICLSLTTRLSQIKLTRLHEIFYRTIKIWAVFLRASGTMHASQWNSTFYAFIIRWVSPGYQYDRLNIHKQTPWA